MPPRRRDAARDGADDRWDADRRAEPAASRIILAHIGDEVKMLNDSARERLRRRKVRSATASRSRLSAGRASSRQGTASCSSATSDELGVKNGTLGTVERASAKRLAVRLDDGERVDVDLKTLCPC